MMTCQPRKLSGKGSHLVEFGSCFVGSAAPLVAAANAPGVVAADAAVLLEVVAAVQLEVG